YRGPAHRLLPRVVLKAQATQRTDAMNRNSDSGAFFALASLALGFLVAVIGAVAIFMWGDAHSARNAARTAAAQVASGQSGQTTMPMTDTPSAGAGGLASYAGAAPANADELASAHRPYSALLPPLKPGPVAHFNLVLTDRTVDIAPGVKYAAWAWAGGAPGTIVHVRIGQWVEVMLES